MTDEQIALYRSPAAANAGALSLTGFGRQRVAAQIVDRRLPLHAAVLVESGHGSLQTERGGAQTIVAPALFWLVAGARHSYGPTPGESWLERWVLFEGPLAFDFIKQRLIVETAPLVSLRNLCEMQQLFSNIETDFAGGNALSLSSASATLHRIAVQAARQAQAANKTPPHANIETAVEALQQRAFRPVDMQEFAEEFGISQPTLRRRFAAATGLSPKAFQLRLRIDHAKQLLTTSDLAVEAVSGAVGIDDAFYFSRLFRDREGCSPSDFRRRHRRL